jgi:hypothetical protein
MGKKYMQGFVAKPEGQKLLAKPKCRWNDNENVFLKEMVRGLGPDFLRIGTGVCLLSTP